MRQIDISTDVFAKIWALRLAGENSEDSILKRVLWSLPQDPTASVLRQNAPTPASPASGFSDSRYGVRVPEGFEIYRTYLGQAFRARASGGKWTLKNNGEAYDSLNELSRAIGARTENAWKNWYFDDAVNGIRRLVGDLRDQAKVATRSREMEMENSIAQLDNAQSRPPGTPAALFPDGTWRDDVRTALQNLGGRASLNRLYKEVERLRRGAGRTVPSSLEATVRRTLEDHSSDSDNYRGVDLFCMPEGKGAGVWALR